MRVMWISSWVCLPERVSQSFVTNTRSCVMSENVCAKQKQLFNMFKRTLIAVVMKKPVTAHLRLFLDVYESVMVMNCTSLLYCKRVPFFSLAEDRVYVLYVINTLSHKCERAFYCSPLIAEWLPHYLQTLVGCTSTSFSLARHCVYERLKWTKHDLWRVRNLQCTDIVLHHT